MQHICFCVWVQTRFCEHWSAHLNGVSLQGVLVGLRGKRPLDGHDHLGPLLQELLLRLLDDDGVGVAHHGDQHVEEQDGDEDLEEHEDCLGHGGVGTVVKLVVLEIKFQNKLEVF